ncbi:hypothetical protein [Actinophytocola sp.]|uniref:hypothetical protein n=1 Tax=Actinophytocola sp. TaxID=1872138 RepID=UPI002ED04CBB
MLTLEQQGYAGCLVSEDGRQITQFTRFAGTPCVIDGTEYRFGHGQGARYVLEGPVGVTAVSYASGRREVTIEATPHQLQLRRLTWLGRRWEIHALGQRIGTCRVTMFGASGDLPAELPLPLRVFTLYTVLMSSGSLVSILPWF